MRGLGDGLHVIQRFRISDAHNFDLFQTKELPGSTIVLSSDLPSPGVELVEIR
jgi:hypothetical protein